MTFLNDLSLIQSREIGLHLVNEEDIDSHEFLHELKINF